MDSGSQDKGRAYISISMCSMYREKATFVVGTVTKSSHGLMWYAHSQCIILIMISIDSWVRLIFQRWPCRSCKVFQGLFYKYIFLVENIYFSSRLMSKTMYILAQGSAGASNQKVHLSVATSSCLGSFPETLPDAPQNNLPFNSLP